MAFPNGCRGRYTFRESYHVRRARHVCPQTAFIITTVEIVDRTSCSRERNYNTSGCGTACVRKLNEHTVVLGFDRLRRDTSSMPRANLVSWIAATAQFRFRRRCRFRVLILIRHISVLYGTVLAPVPVRDGGTKDDLLTSPRRPCVSRTSRSTASPRALSSRLALRSSSKSTVSLDG